MNSWEPIHNPYIVGNPIRGTKLFFGREDDFAFIKAKFSGDREGGLIVLCGARRSGKTSVLFQILDGRLGDDFLPVLIDMQSMAIVNDHQFVHRLLELIEDAAEAAGVSPGSAERTDGPFADVEGYIARLSVVLKHRKLILAFDEYELIETGIDSGAISTQMLRTLATLIEHRKVFVLFTGSEKLEARSKKYWDMFLSKALHRRISFLSRDDTLRLIREPVADSIEYADGVPERIHDLTAGQPFYTQVICQNVVDHLNDEHKNVVGMEEVEHAVEEVIQNPLPQMVFHWNGLSDLEKLSLAIMAELTRNERRAITPAEILAFTRTEKIGYKINPNALNKALDRLFHGDLVQTDSKSGGFGFKMDVWRLWAMRMHSVWQVLGGMEQGGGPAADSGIVKVAPRAATPGWAWWAAGSLFEPIAVVVLMVVALIATLAGYEFKPRPHSSAASHRGWIVARTRPAGADIRIDNVARGKAPLAVALPSGKHTVTAEKDGYSAYTINEATVSERETTSVYLPLEELSEAVQERP